MLSYLLGEDLGRFYEGEVGRLEVGGGQKEETDKCQIVC